MAQIRHREVNKEPEKKRGGGFLQPVRRRRRWLGRGRFGRPGQFRRRRLLATKTGLLALVLAGTTVAGGTGVAVTGCSAPAIRTSRARTSSSSRPGPRTPRLTRTRRPPQGRTSASSTTSPRSIPSSGRYARRHGGGAEGRRPTPATKCRGGGECGVAQRGCGRPATAPPRACSRIRRSWAP